MTLDLDKAERATMHCEAWANTVRFAARLSRKPYGEDLLMDMTMSFLDRLNYNPETLEITVPADLGGDVLQAVHDWEPPVEQTPQPQAATLPTGPVEIGVLQAIARETVAATITALADALPDTAIDAALADLETT